jgi:hypothetical protein
MISFALILMTLPSRVAAARAGRAVSSLPPRERRSAAGNCDGLSSSSSRQTEKEQR